MPSCLGIYTDRNMIKYAKVTSVIEKIGGQTLTLDAYGVKFYDNMQATIEEIFEEVGVGPAGATTALTVTGANNNSVALALSNEEFYMTEVFSNLTKKDMLQLVTSEYHEKMGEHAIPQAVLEMRTKLALNSGSVDKAIVISAMTSTGELANIRNSFSYYKIGIISHLSASIKNIFPNQAIDEEDIVVNI